MAWSTEGERCVVRIRASSGRIFRLNGGGLGAWTSQGRRTTSPQSSGLGLLGARERRRGKESSIYTLERRRPSRRVAPRQWPLGFTPGRRRCGWACSMTSSPRGARMIESRLSSVSLRGREHVPNPWRGSLPKGGCYVGSDGLKKSDRSLRSKPRDSTAKVRSEGHGDQRSPPRRNELLDDDRPSVSPTRHWARRPWSRRLRAQAPFEAGLVSRRTRMGRNSRSSSSRPTP